VPLIVAIWWAATPVTWQEVAENSIVAVNGDSRMLRLHVEYQTRNVAEGIAAVFPEASDAIQQDAFRGPWCTRRYTDW
jgi:hypothetical protein